MLQNVMNQIGNFGKEPDDDYVSEFKRAILVENYDNVS